MVSQHPQLCLFPPEQSSPLPASPWTGRAPLELRSSQANSTYLQRMLLSHRKEVFPKKYWSRATHFLFLHLNSSPAGHRRRQACSREHHCGQRAGRIGAHPGGCVSTKGEALPRVLAQNPAVGPGRRGREEAEGRLPSKGAGRSGGSAPHPPGGIGTSAPTHHRHRRGEELSQKKACRP